MWIVDKLLWGTIIARINLGIHLKNQHTNAFDNHEDVVQSFSNMNVMMYVLRSKPNQDHADRGF